MSKYKIGVIIPFYKESFQEIAPLLYSINNQLGVDLSAVKVILACDGGNPAPIEEGLKQQDYKFSYIVANREENGGPGLARQYGIDNAHDCEYVMFCDADDILHSVLIVRTYLDNINAHSRPDVLVSKWLEELCLEDGSFIYIPHDYDFTWMHGICYRVAFLNYHNIRFHEDLRIHEDSYFNAIACERSASTIYIDTPTYIWRFVPGSITRADNALYSYSGVPTFYKSIRLSFKEIEKFKPESLHFRVTQTLFYGYFDLIKPEWELEQNKKYYPQALKEYKQLYDEFSQYFNEVSEIDKQKIKIQENARFTVGYEKITFDQFIQSLDQNLA